MRRRGSPLGGGNALNTTQVRRVKVGSLEKSCRCSRGVGAGVTRRAVAWGAPKWQTLASARLLSPGLSAPRAQPAEAQNALGKRRAGLGQRRPGLSEARPPSETVNTPSARSPPEEDCVALKAGRRCVLINRGPSHTETALWRRSPVAPSGKRESGTRARGGHGRQARRGGERARCGAGLNSHGWTTAKPPDARLAGAISPESWVVNPSRPRDPFSPLAGRCVGRGRRCAGGPPLNSRVQER